MGVFWDRLNLCSTAAPAPTAGLTKTKADIENKSSHSCLSRWLNSNMNFFYKYELKAD